MSTEFRIADETAIVRREDRVVVLALDGRLDPEPVVVQESGIVIFDALGSWTTIESLTDVVTEQFSVDPSAAEADIRGFVCRLRDHGIVVAQPATDGASE